MVEGGGRLDQRTGGKGGDLTGPNPVDRGKSGSKLHVICDRKGLPLAVLVTVANVHDSPLLLPMLDSVPAIRTPGGRRRLRPDKLHADKAYDARELCCEVRRRGIKMRIARKGIESSTRLGRHRWVVEACMGRSTPSQAAREAARVAAGELRTELAAVADRQPSVCVTTAAGEPGPCGHDNIDAGELRNALNRVGLADHVVRPARSDDINEGRGRPPTDGSSC
ncbi:transposase [Micromonospora sp. U56]|uniref:transposase n=1 Tax=Micromonospora sp. U56 TaxID=2824900 RepID=UPI0027DCB62D|nr:transposase [Micromonospora sp. U56]